MLFTTPTQFAVLLLMLIVGWLFGFASHPGGKKWKRAYRAEQAARAQDLAERDERVRALEVRNAELVAAQGNASGAAPVAAGAVTTADRTGRAGDAPAGKRGWFEWGAGDPTRA